MTEAVKTLDIEELKRERFGWLNKARELVDGAEAEKRDLTDEERESYDDAIEKADSIEQRIKREEELNRRHGVFASPGPKTGRPTPSPFIGMSEDEANRYSLIRAIRCAASGDWQEGGLELEASKAVEKVMGRSPRGFWVPMDWMQKRQSLTPEQRDLVKGTAGSGGYLAATDLLGESFIDRLTNKMVMAQAGVVTLTGLVGDVAIPRLATGPTAYWVAENTDLTEGAMTFEQVTFTPKTVGAFLDISRRLIQQASLDVEELVRNDIARSLALAMDLAILQGTGTDQPTGVKGITGVTDLSGNDGTDMAWGDVVDLESAISEANADSGRLAYVTNPHMRGVLKQTLITATYGDKMIWQDGATPLNSYAAYVTSQIPKNLTKGGGSDLSYVFYGDWSTVLLGSWGSLDVLSDPYTGSKAGTVRVIAFNDMDVGVRHPAAIVYGYYY